MPKPKNFIRIGVDVNPEIIKQVDEIANRERWSRKMVATVALEYYLKLRGMKNEDSKTFKSD